MSVPEDLILLAQAGDRDAAERLVTENSGLIWAVARRFLGRGVETEDLYQLGCMGFLKAIEGFDPSYGTQFSTYAVPKIAGEIRRFLRDDGAVKVSRSVKERSAAIRACRARLAASLGREPTLLELSQELGISPEDIALAETATAATESIQRQTGDEGFSLEDVLTDTESEEQMLEKIALRQAISKLPQRERMVLQRRCFHGLPQQRVAKLLDISQVQVSRVERRAMEQLRLLLEEN